VPVAAKLKLTEFEAVEILKVSFATGISAGVITICAFRIIEQAKVNKRVNFVFIIQVYCVCKINKRIFMTCNYYISCPKGV